MIIRRLAVVAIAGVILLVLWGMFHVHNRYRAGADQRSESKTQSFAECLAYEAAPSTLVFELPGDAVKVGEHELNEPGSVQPTAISHVPQCVSRLYQSTGMRTSVHSILFAHRLTHPFIDALVIIEASPVLGTSSDMTINIVQWPVLDEKVADPSGYETSFAKLRSEAALSQAITGPVRFFAGQIDPADPSKFTIEYEAPNERGTIIGIYESWARDGVRLTIRQR